MTANMAMTFVPAGDRSPEIVIALHTVVPPSDAEWRIWIALLRSRAEVLDWDFSRSANLVITDGGAPDHDQRMSIDMLVSRGKHPPKVAVVTDSRVVRTIVRALSVFNPVARVFAPAKFDEALQFLGIPLERRDEILALCTRVADEKLGEDAIQTLSALNTRAD